MYAYNPRKKSYLQLEQSLVGKERWDMINSIIRELTLKKGEKPKQHWIIVGPRGIGKSHLLTLLYYKIKNDDRLNQIWIPILLPEELRTATSLARFLERVLKEILLEIQQSNDPISMELKVQIEKASNTPASERVDILFSVISWLHQQRGYFILLIVENLQHLLGRKFPVIEQKKLRALLQTSDVLLIIGSATTIFGSLHDHSHPFYHFFHMRRLGELLYEDMRTLVTKNLTDTGAHELSLKLNQNDARLRTLYAFTGGNPRMAVFLADILRTEVPDEMLELMDRILDELTPYFLHIIESVPDYLEEVINVLADFEPAQSPKEIAEHLEVPQATIRNYLKHLKEDGYVRIAFSQGKSNYYSLNEYLYRIWFQMRDSSHREDTRWLLELLLILYSRQTILEEKEKITASFGEHSFPIFNNLMLKAADFIEAHPNYCRSIEMCVESIEFNKKKLEKQEEKLVTSALQHIENGEYERAIEMCKELIKINPNSLNGFILWGDSLRALKSYDAAIDKCKKVVEIRPELEFGYELWGICLSKQGFYKEAIQKFEKAAEINPTLVNTFWFWGDCLRRQGRYEEAIEKFNEEIKINPHSFESYGALGDCLRELERYDEAENSYRKAIEVNGKYGDAYIAWGACLARRKRFEEAIDKIKKGIDIIQDSEAGYTLWGICLWEQKKYGEAIEKFRKVVEINPLSDAGYLALGICLMEQGIYKDALVKVRKALEINPYSKRAYLLLGVLMEKRGENEKAIVAYLKYIMICHEISSGDFNFKEDYDKYISQSLKKLKPGNYIRKLYAPEKEDFSLIELTVLLILLENYDVVGGQFQDVLEEYRRKEKKEQDFRLLIFTIGLSVFMKLVDGKIHQSLRLIRFYIDYIKSLKDKGEQDNKVLNFSKELLRVQVHFSVKPEHTQEVLNCLKNEKGIPFNDIILKIWACISNPDSTEALRYISDKAVSALVKEIKNKGYTA